MDANAPIAIIGMSCRFAGGIKNPRDLWQLCAEGRTGWTEIPKSRFNLESVYHPCAEKTDTTNVIGGHFLDEDVALFDAGFFNLSSETAAAMDPQFRLQLESTYEALESAGIPIEKVAGSNTSVFAGAFFRDYSEANTRDPETLPRFLLLGVGTAMAANRISHFYDLRGASMTVDTGCSTTLTAVHQACQSLRAGESDMSIVGGANVMLNPDNFIVMSSLSLLGATGKSYAFDSRAEGYGRGEGSATVILKRLDDAIRDGDPIRAVIRATGVNQDGKTETVTTPSQEAQEALIRACYRKAGLDPSLTTYFEAHGTGTRTGDPIEARAIASVFGPSRPPEQALRLGSVKTNVGHTETASGLASIIKVALALEAGQVPPSANFDKPNEQLQLDDWHLKVPTELENWTTVGSEIRRASINNFGYGGANAHVIMDEYQAEVHQKTNGTNGVHKPNGVANGITNGTNGAAPGLMMNGHHGAASHSKVIVLSAKDESACQAVASNLREYLMQKEDLEDGKLLDNLSYTLGQRRSRFAWATAQPVSSIKGLIGAIESGSMKPQRRMEKAPRLGFVYTGQGAQWFAMGRELIAAYPVFKDCLLEADGYLKELGAPWSLIEELQRDEATTRVNEVALSTPLCVALQVALTRLLESWGIVPSAVTSHSSGEMAAACVVGAMDLRCTMASVLSRGELASEISNLQDSNGGMMAVGLSAEDLESQYLSQIKTGRLVCACLNSPTSTTVSGDASALDELELMMQERHIFARRLKVDAAWHSHHVLPIAGPYRKFLQKYISPQGDRKLQDIIFSSPTTGHRVQRLGHLGEPQHWVDSLLSPVQFVDAFHHMCFSEERDVVDIDMVIEVGPHAALSGPIHEIMATLPAFETKLPYGSCLIRKKDAVTTMQALAAQLLQQGYPVNLEAVNFPHGRHSTLVLSDLPSYPWNHTVRHWAESRINKAFRHRQEPPHDLLGVQLIGGNKLAPTWRHVLRMADLPWVRDHIVQANVVYPGAGYLCMAIEGVRSHVTHQQSQLTIHGYSLRDIDILQALIIPESTDGIEVQLTLRPSNVKDISATGWFEFQVCSVTPDDIWVEHCKGLIQARYAPCKPGDGSPGALNKSMWLGQADYRIRIDPRALYGDLRAVGIHHGPIFQNLKAIRARENQSVSVFDVADTQRTMPARHQQHHVIHPTTLDTVFQAAYTSLAGAGSNTSTNSRIPRSIKHLWVASNMCTEPGHLFKAYSQLRSDTPRSFEADIAVLEGQKVEGGGDSPLLTVTGFVCQSIGNTVSTEDSSKDSFRNEKFVTSRWAPDITYLTPAFWKEELAHKVDQDEAEILRDLRRLCVYFINNALSSLTAGDVSRLEPHHKKFYIWMKLQAELAGRNKLAPDSAQWGLASQDDIVRLLDKVTAASVNGEMVGRLGPELVAILRGEVTPLSIMLADGFLNRYYEDALKLDRSTRQVERIVRHLVHKNPRARIIEIGAGTGGATTSALTAVGTDEAPGGPQAEVYDFTDISVGFFDAAKEKLQPWKNLVRYKKLDIERDPVAQGFEEGSYDLVIACQVLHATQSMLTTMKNVRRLLKPDGKIIFIETTQDQMDVQLAFGLLPGWWLSEEEERKYSPSLSIDMWDRVLRNSGFNGIDFEVHDCESEELYCFSVIMATATAPAAELQTSVLPIPCKKHTEPVIVTHGSDTPGWWLDALKSSIAGVSGGIPAVQPLEGLQGDTEKVYIFLGEVGRPILEDLDQTLFEAIKTLCITSQGVLWVTRGVFPHGENVHAALNVGFLRSIRMEYSGKRLAALDIDSEPPLWSLQSVSTITDIFRGVFDDGSNDVSNRDFEFSERNGIISIPRYHKDVARNQLVFPDASKSPVAELKTLHQAGRPLRLFIGTPGLLDTLAWDDDPDARQDQLDDEIVEVEPQAFGLNFRDVMVAMGQLNSGLMGFECAGVVTRVGSKAVAQGYQPGDRVMMLLRGYYGNLARVHWTSVVHIPDEMSFEVAATLPVSYCTAYVSIFNTARLQKGERILIHAATGAFGQAALVLARHIGAEIFVTAGTPAKREFIMQTYGIEPDHIFSSRDTSFAAEVLAMTGGKGVDVVLNSLAGPLLQESFNCMAPFGRFVEIGKRDLEQNSHLALGAFTRHVSFSSIDLLLFADHRGAEIHQVLKEVLQLYKENVIVPVSPVAVYSVSEIEKAYRLMQAGKHMGKIVIAMNRDALVPILPSRKAAKLRADSSYLVIGGLGGIGRSVCHWMVRHGARNIIIISRSAKVKGIAIPFLAEMERAGSTVRIASCDISDEQQLSEALNECADMPPIRGVIQAAMILQDSILERMTLDDFNAGLRPKVHGTWNLHRQFSGQALDFFIMFSSIVGIAGYASQSSYSAGGAFQDALAKYRTSRGLPAVSIDLGQVSSVGYVAESDGVSDRLLKQGFSLMSEDDVLKTFENAILDPFATQLIVGIETGPGKHWEDSTIARDMRFSPLRYRETGQNANSSSKSSKVGATDLASRIAAATSLDEAVAVVAEGLTKKLTSIFMIDEAEINPTKQLSSYGVDSLVAVELRNMLSLRAGAEVSIFDIMQSPSINALAQAVAAKSSHLSI